MGTNAHRLAVLCLAFALAGCTSSSSPSSQATTSSLSPTATANQPSQPAKFTPCRDARNSVKMIEGISPATGEHAFLIQVLYAGGHRCSITGYPKVTFIAAGGTPMPFRYRDDGGQYLTHRPPTYVNLRPGDTFFIAIAKYRCDIRTEKSARFVVVQIPGGQQPLRIDLNQPGGPGPRVTSIDYCAETPSQVVYLSPIEATEPGLFQ